MTLSQRRIILASASPRRKELLGLTGLSFTCIPSYKEETTVFTEPERYVSDLSVHKAEDILEKEQPENYLIIGADTIVSHKGALLGKPKDAEEAFVMLTSLQNDTHEVYTGVTLLWDDKGPKQKTFAVCTHVRILAMTEEEIRAYIATGDPFDKAGGYGIQTSFGRYVEAIDGDYNNVVGLPLSRLWKEIKNL